MTEVERRAPVQERAQLTRESLLGAAIECFARVGYEAASTRQIETTAGVKRGLIVYHFGTKDALWKAAVAWLFDRAAQDLRVAELSAANVDPADRLRYFVRAFVRFCARYPEVNRLMVHEGMDDDWRLEWLVEHAIGPWYERVRQMYEQARVMGAAPIMDFPHFYYILTGGAALIFCMGPEARRIAGIDTRDQAVIDAHADALVDLLAPRTRD